MLVNNTVAKASVRSILIAFVFVHFASNCSGQEPKGPPRETAWKPLSIPDTKDLGALTQFLDETKKLQPIKAAEYIEMQRSLREVSKKILEIETDRTTPLFRKAESEFVSASVMLLGNEGPDAQRKTFERFQDYLLKKEKIEFIDIQMAVLAGANLEQLTDTTLGKEAYKSFADIFRKKQDASLDDVIKLLEANGKRLDMFGREFKLVGRDFLGEDFDIKSLRGKYVLVYFWSSETQACEQEHPYMSSVYDNYKNLGFEIVGVGLDERKDSAQAFIKRLSIPWINLWDSRKGGVSKVMETYGVTALPTLILLDRDGKVISLEARGLVLGKTLEKLLVKTQPANAANATTAPQTEPPKP